MAQLVSLWASSLEEQPLLRSGREWAPVLQGRPEVLELLRARLLLQLQGTGLSPLAGLGGAPGLLAGAVHLASQLALPRSPERWGQVLPALG